jgi:peptidoglycan hydrolase-like protein with peptidoglycan-binding domain
VSDPTPDPFEEHARRAGAELRRPAPADGLGTVERRLARRHQTRNISAGVLALGLFGGSLAVIARRNDTPKGLQTAPTTAAPSPTTSTEPTTTTAPALTRPLQIGDSGDDVRTLQERLNALKFDVGPVDGVFGENTRAAVWAYADLYRDVKVTPTRSADGVVTPELWKRMQEPLTVADTATDATTRHANVYLAAQLMIVWNAKQVEVITHISTGSGKEWCERPANVAPWPGATTTTVADSDRLQKICGKSVTPGGVFKVYRKTSGETELPLGTATDPVFFNQGIAIHGFSAVPFAPASHGMVRVPPHIGTRLNEFLQVGDNVLVYDGVKDPSVYGAQPPLDDVLDPTDPQIPPGLDPAVAGLNPPTPKPTTAPKAGESPMAGEQSDSGISSDLRMTVGQSGRIITFDAPSGKLSFVGGASVTLDPLLKTQEPDLLTVGPDDVAYFFVHAPNTPDPEYSLVAVSMDVSNPGAVVARSPNFVLPDVQLMPTRDGLVGVSTTAAQRPAATDPLRQHWVDHQGKPIVNAAPILTLNGPPEGPLVVTRRDGDKVTTFAIDDVPPYLYGVPPIVATNDGGIIIFLDATATLGSKPPRLLRYAADGRRVAELRVSDAFPVALAPDGTVYFERTGTTFAATYGRVTLAA